MKKIAIIISALLMACALTACNGNGSKGKESFNGVSLKVGAYRDLRTDPYNYMYGKGADKFLEEYPDSKVEFMVNNNNEALASAVASADPWNIQMIIGVHIPDVFKNELYEPLDDIIDLDNPIYSRRLIEEGATYKGATYGLGHVLMGDFYYGSYNESLFNDYGIKTPAEYYAEDSWNRENLLKMLDDLKRNNINASINFDKPSTSGTYAVSHNDDGTVGLTYGDAQNRNWLSFMRNVIYDKGFKSSRAGSVANREIGYKQDIMPHVLVDAIGSSSIDDIRYIPFLNKDDLSTYIVEYYFGVLRGAADKEASVELINYMIQGCIDERTELYKTNMNEEDYKIFEESALENYYVVRDAGVWPLTSAMDHFNVGGAVSTLISENIDRMQVVVDDYNADMTKE